MTHAEFFFQSLQSSPWVIASRHFNDNPQPLEIQGVRGANRFLFEKLGTSFLWKSGL